MTGTTRDTLVALEVAARHQRHSAARFDALSELREIPSHGQALVVAAGR
jgi:hypothetical protein